jgi:GntR family transcriptional regulator / MocR family aminotransferase
MPLIAPLVECHSISLSPESKIPLYQQLYQALRVQIMNKSLISGQRLPGSREIAKELKVSRNTVQLALAQLQSEGYLEARVGSGVYVSAIIPDNFHQVSNFKQMQSTDETIEPHVTLSTFAKRCQEQVCPAPLANKAFSPGIPDHHSFPHHIWLKIWHKHLRGNPLTKTNLLEQALCDHLRYTRGINCIPEQVFITNGAAQALYLAASALIDPGNTVVAEEPSYFIKNNLAHALGAQVATCPVDKQGLCIEQLPDYPPKFMYTTPSHQYPLGSNMPISRRIELLNWALKNNTYIIEDDYDSEFHYTSKPLPALQGLDGNELVLYVGSLSRTILPSLRLGYLIVPKHLTTTFKKILWVTGSPTEPIKKSVAAEFILEGHFARHLKKMRLLYKSKLKIAINACKKHLGEWCEIQEPSAGMHLALILKNNLSDTAIVDQLKKQGIHCNPLSDYYCQGNKINGLVLGISHMQEKEIIQGVVAIEKLLKKLGASFP